MLLSERGQSWRCGKVLVPHKEPVLTQVTLECHSVNPDPQGGTQLLLLQREAHPEEGDGATAGQTQGLQGPEGPPDIPQLTVCAPDFHPLCPVP